MAVGISASPNSQELIRTADRTRNAPQLMEFDQSRQRRLAELDKTILDAQSRADT
jgi:hypothetical protein